MHVGETINRLRLERGLSQEELAAALGVSRQSISKWETDASVPELDKLVKLAELFGVSMDALVTGQSDPPPPEPAPQPEAVPARVGLPGRMVAGTILLCMAFLVVLICAVRGGVLEGLILALPFVLCGSICLLARRHPGLWCFWGLFLLVDGYLRFATGLSWAVVRWTLQWTPQMNYMRLAIAWCQLLGALALLAVTVGRLGKEPMEWTQKRKRLALLGGIVFALLCLPWSTWTFLAGGLPLSGIVTLESWLQDGLRLALLAAVLTAVRRGKRKT